MKRILVPRSLMTLLLIIALSGCGGSGGGSTPPQHQFTTDSNTMALWHFNENPGALSVTDSCNNYPLTLYPAANLPTFVSRDANFGNCLSLDGTYKQYAFSNSYTTAKYYGSQLTVEFWMKFSSVPSDETLIQDIDPALIINIDTSKHIHSYIYDKSIGSGGDWNGSLNSTTTLAPNVWHYIALTYDGPNTNLYLDGVLDCSTAAHFIPYTNPSRGWWVGSNSSLYFTGQIDEMRILTVARSASEIQNYYSQAIQP